MIKEWKNEPVELSWVDQDTGYQCYARRSSIDSFWCGYVLIPKDHTAYGKPYESLDIDCHGGLTYSDIHSDKDLWQLGFDCAHCGDYIPNWPMISLDTSRVYRNLEFVKSECTSIAKQLKSMS